MWEVEYEPEAANYLFDNGQLVAPLFFAMEALANTEGIPPSGMLQIQPGLFSGVVEQHQLIFRRNEKRRIVSIVAIRPPV